MHKRYSTKRYLREVEIPKSKLILALIIVLGAFSGILPLSSSEALANPLNDASRADDPSERGASESTSTPAREQDSDLALDPKPTLIKDDEPLHETAKESAGQTVESLRNSVSPEPASRIAEQTNEAVKTAPQTGTRVDQSVGQSPRATEPIDQTAEPVVKPDSQTVQPMTTQPISQTVEPVTESRAVEPVTEMVHRRTKQPLVEQVDQTVDPATKLLSETASEIAEPVLTQPPPRTVEPAIETATRVVELPVEPASNTIGSMVKRIKQLVGSVQDGVSSGAKSVRELVEEMVAELVGELAKSIELVRDTVEPVVSLVQLPEPVVGSAPQGKNLIAPLGPAVATTPATQSGQTPPAAVSDNPEPLQRSIVAESTREAGIPVRDSVAAQLIFSPTTSLRMNVSTVVGANNLSAATTSEDSVLFARPPPGPGLAFLLLEDARKGSHARLFGYTLTSEHLATLGLAVLKSAPAQAPHPFPFGFPSGAPPAGSSFRGASSNLGLDDLLGVLTLALILSSACALLRSPSEVLKLGSSLRLVTELPG